MKVSRGFPIRWQIPLLMRSYSSACRQGTLSTESKFWWTIGVFFHLKQHYKLCWGFGIGYGDHNFYEAIDLLISIISSVRFVIISRVTNGLGVNPYDSKDERVKLDQLSKHDADNCLLCSLYEYTCCLSLYSPLRLP